MTPKKSQPGTSYNTLLCLLTSETENRKLVQESSENVAFCNTLLCLLTSETVERILVSDKSVNVTESRRGEETIRGIHKGQKRQYSVFEDGEETIQRFHQGKDKTFDYDKPAKLKPQHSSPPHILQSPVPLTDTANTPFLPPERIRCAAPTACC